MARAVLPETLVGDFFLLAFNRESKVYTIHIDDDDESSYKLGSEIPTIMMRFKVWGHSDLGNKAIDFAREFGMAQAIFKDGRIIPIYEKPKPPVLKFGDEEDEDARYVVIPPLRASV